MTKSRYSKTKIVAVLKEAAHGMPVSELYRANGICSAEFYQ